MSSLLSDIPPYASMRVAERAQSRSDMLNFGLGEPWFGPPPIVSQMLQSSALRASAFASYLHRGGDAELRGHIALRYASRGSSCDPDTELLVTHGAAGAFYLAVLSSTNLGDEVMLTDPTYMLYAPVCRMLGREVRRVSTPPSATSPSIEHLAKAVTDRTRLIVINSPQNPAGTVVDQSTMDSFVEFASERRMTLLHDEVYDDFVYDSVQPGSALRHPSGSALAINSFSKRYGLPGLRVGWLAGPAEFITRAQRAQDFLALSLGPASIAIATAVMGDLATNESWLPARVVELAARRDELYDVLSQNGLTFPTGRPQGGMFLFPDVRGIAKKLGFSDPANAGDAVATHIEREWGALVVPGATYGTGVAGHVRFVFAVERHLISELSERLRSLKTTNGRI